MAGAVGLFLVAVLVFSGGGSSKRGVTLAFAGFTNSDAGTRAYFWVTNSALAAFTLSTFAGTMRNGDSPRLIECSIRVEKVLPNEDKERSGRRLYREVLLSVEVAEAKLPLRTVMEVWESPPDRSQLAEWFLGLMPGRNRRVANLIPKGPHYSVTNEFHLKP